MSYDLEIYFPHTEFPLQRWQTLLDSFGAREVPEESDETYREWLAHGEGDGVFIGLGPVGRTRAITNAAHRTADGWSA